jgi:hypothetical protein
VIPPAVRQLYSAQPALSSTTWPDHPAWDHFSDVICE